MQQQQQGEIKIEDSGFAPSFSFYASESVTSTAVAKVIGEEEEEAANRFHENRDVDGDDFEFSFVFKRDLMENDVVDGKIKPMDDEIDASSAITRSLRKMFIDKREESSSYSSSEADESESSRSTGSGSSEVISKCNKGSSTGSGSKRWIFRYLIRRGNSEGKQPTVLLTPTKVDSPKHKQNSGGRWKAQTPVHEQFYVQRRAENEVGKRKTFLPYRKDLVGLFANVNGVGKMLSV